MSTVIESMQEQGQAPFNPFCAEVAKKYNVSPGWAYHKGREFASIDLKYGKLFISNEGMASVLELASQYTGSIKPVNRRAKSSRQGYAKRAEQATKTTKGIGFTDSVGQETMSGRLMVLAAEIEQLELFVSKLKESLVGIELH